MVVRLQMLHVLRDVAVLLVARRAAAMGRCGKGASVVSEQHRRRGREGAEGRTRTDRASGRSPSVPQSSAPPRPGPSGGTPGVSIHPSPAVQSCWEATHDPFVSRRVAQAGPALARELPPALSRDLVEHARVLPELAEPETGCGRLDRDRGRAAWRRARSERGGRSTSEQTDDRVSQGIRPLQGQSWRRRQIAPSFRGPERTGLRS